MCHYGNVATLIVVTLVNHIEALCLLIFLLMVHSFVRVVGRGEPTLGETKFSNEIAVQANMHHRGIDTPAVI